MSLVRALLFNLAFYLWTLLLGLYALPLLLAPRRVVMSFGRMWSRVTLWLLARIVGLRHEVRGLDHLPAEGCIIAMKHQSAWDTLAMPVVFGDPAVVIKQELSWLPIYGWYARRAGVITVDRGGGAGALKHMVKQAREAAAAGRPIAIFPEGTRTAVGERRPYHPGVAALYAQLDLPLVPVAVNSGLFWGRRAFMKRPGRIVVEILPAIAPGMARRALMGEIESRIEGATARLVAEGGGQATAAGAGYACDAGRRS